PLQHERREFRHREPRLIPYSRFKRPFEIQTIVCDQKMAGGGGFVHIVFRLRKPGRSPFRRRAVRTPARGPLLNSNDCLKNLENSGEPMTRAADYTRQNIMKAAVALFAERGYEGASVRAIVSKAGVNQAAINYHFKGKDGLYLEVLKMAFEGYTRLDGFDPEKLKDRPREEALRNFVQQQLRPLLARDEMSRFIRIFAWENVQPSKALRKLITTSATPFLARAAELVRRFLPPGTSDQDAACTAIWLM